MAQQFVDGTDLGVELARRYRCQASVEHRKVAPRASGLSSLDLVTLLDPWDNPYRLVVPGTDGRAFDIVSNGPDGAPGGGDDIVR